MLRETVSARARWLIGVACALAFGTHVAPAAAKYKVIYSFCSQGACADGYGPNVGVISDPQGNLYGTT